MVVLVTGANGFIGSALVERLRTRGAEVRAMIRRPETAAPLESLGAGIAIADVRDADAVRDAARGCDVVVHSAGWVGTWGSADEIRATNEGGTDNTVRAAVAGGVRRFVHISSTGVYGSAPGLNVDERSPCRLSGQPYHDSKVLAERVVIEAKDDLQVVVLRPSHVFGPGSPHFTLRPLKMLKKRALVIDGGCGHFKPVWIDNLLDAIEAATAPGLESGLTVNVTDGYVKTWRELFEGYGAALGHEVRWRSIPRPIAMMLAVGCEGVARIGGPRPFLNRETVRVLTSTNSYSNRRAMHALDWKPKVDWDEALERTARWVHTSGGLSAVLQEMTS